MDASADYMEPEVVTRLSRCREITRDIRAREREVVLDAEGVRLSATGPLTLLQMMTSHGDVYLFDVQSERDLICEGGIREILESPSITKIVHACFSDSGALFHQFEQTKLQNVFDTSVAHVVIEEHVHRQKFPYHLGLSDLVTKYGGKVDKAKTLKEEWKYDEKFWEKRPLTQEMINYAAGDVRMLYPTVYSELRRQIETNNLWEPFNEQVEENINEQIDRERIVEQRKQRKLRRINDVLDELEATKGRGRSLGQLRDFTDDHQTALWESLREDVPVSATLVRMRNNLFALTLDRMELEMKSDRREFVNKKFNRHEENRIKVLQEKGSADSAQRADRLMNEVTKERTKKAIYKISKDKTLGTGEKFLLMRVDIDLFSRQEKQKIRNARNVVAKQFEEEVKKTLKGRAENYQLLRDTDQKLLKEIPAECLRDYVVKRAREMLPQGD